MMQVSPEPVAWYGKPRSADQTDESLSAEAQDGLSVLHFTGRLYDRILTSRDGLSAEVPMAFEARGLPAVLRILRVQIGPGVALDAWGELDPHTGQPDTVAPLLGLVDRDRSGTASMRWWGTPTDARTLVTS